jgi:hypothetical protein
MEGILEETTLFVEERERSLARLTSFEPLDEDPPDLELSSQAEDSDEQSGAAEDGSGAAEDGPTGELYSMLQGLSHPRLKETGQQMGLCMCSVDCSFFEMWCSRSWTV